MISVKTLDGYKCYIDKSLINMSKKLQTNLNDLKFTTSDIIWIINKWLSVFDAYNIKNYPEHSIFKSSFFYDFDMQTLLKIYDYAFLNNIDLLTNTIAYTIVSRNIYITQNYQIYGITISKECANHLLMYMSENYFNKQDIQKPNEHIQVNIVME